MQLMGLEAGYQYALPVDFKVAEAVRLSANCFHLVVKAYGDSIRTSETPHTRIHSAVVCASISCPPLRREAYLAAQLDQQLDGNVRAWLANPALNRFDPTAKKAEVSMIFDWYKGDFIKNGSSVALFLERFAPQGQAAFLHEPGIKLNYQEYHWGVNDAAGTGSGYSHTSFLRDYLRNKL